MSISLQYSRCLIVLTSICLFLGKIPKSTSRFLNIITANDNTNWVNVLEKEKHLPFLEVTMIQQPLQSINFLAKTLRKLTANLTSITNSALPVART